MKIAVCVKQVPEAAVHKRIDSATKRLDRSGEAGLNSFDANAIEEALRIKEAAGEGEVVLVSMGPARAVDAMRKGLAMGADRALLVADDEAAGSDLVATSYVLAKLLEREQPDLVLFGQQASDSDGLEMLRTSAKDASSVVSRLREFYRPVDSEEEFPIVDLARLVQQAVALTEPKWRGLTQARGITVDVQTNFKAYPIVAGDESALREVLTNLLFNAVDAMPQGGRVSLEGMRGGESVRIEGDASAPQKIVDYLAEKKLI